MHHKTWFIALLVLLFGTIGFVTYTKKAHGAKEYQTLAGSGFTYQGQLKQNGLPANDTCDFRFRLWTAASEGVQVSDDQMSVNVTVSDGYFSIPSLDFGNSAFNGEARWLEIAVKCVGETAYTTLSPRQPITPAPYALALPGLYTQENDVSSNVLGGFHGNQVTEGVYGAAISGGGAVDHANQVTDHYGTVAGGGNNRAGDHDATLDNSSYANVGGGENNIASGHHALVAGGGDNSASVSYSAIGGGNNNTADGEYSTVGGGRDNHTSGSASTIGGGGGNTVAITGAYAVIGGGLDNLASGLGSSVGGGESNSATNSHTAISGGKNNTAQGQAALVSGGENNIANGQYASIGGGQANIAAGDYSTIPGGYQAETALYGQTAYASGAFSENGDAQSSTYLLRNITTDTVATELFLDGASARLTIAPNRTLAFEIFIVARRNMYTQSAGYVYRGLIKNDDGETKFIGSPSLVTLGEDNPAWEVILLANDAYDSLIIQVSGAENATIRWVATVKAVEVAW